MTYEEIYEELTTLLRDYREHVEARTVTAEYRESFTVLNQLTVETNEFGMITLYKHYQFDDLCTVEWVKNEVLSGNRQGIPCDRVVCAKGIEFFAKQGTAAKKLKGGDCIFVSGELLARIQFKRVGEPPALALMNDRQKDLYCVSFRKENPRFQRTSDPLAIGTACLTYSGACSHLYALCGEYRKRMMADAQETNRTMPAFQKQYQCTVEAKGQAQNFTLQKVIQLDDLFQVTRIYADRIQVKSGFFGGMKTVNCITIQCGDLVHINVRQHHGAESLQAGDYIRIKGHLLAIVDASRYDDSHDKIRKLICPPENRFSVQVRKEKQ